MRQAQGKELPQRRVPQGCTMSMHLQGKELHQQRGACAPGLHDEHAPAGSGSTAHIVFFLFLSLPVMQMRWHEQHGPYMILSGLIGREQQHGPNELFQQCGPYEDEVRVAAGHRHVSGVRVAAIMAQACLSSHHGPGLFQAHIAASVGCTCLRQALEGLACITVGGTDQACATKLEFLLYLLAVEGGGPGAAHWGEGCASCGTVY
eukprot:1143362-Pelagomonas_calceolata.AAC.5